MSRISANVAEFARIPQTTGDAPNSGEFGYGQRASAATKLALRVAGLVVLLLPGVVAAQPLRLQEQFPVGYGYRISSRVDLSGQLIPPAGMGQPGKAITVSGNSAIDYDERVLEADREGGVAKTIRFYRRVDLKRKVGDRDEESQLRLNVRRLVLLRNRHAEVPFSPDGPLLWSEIELVRTDVFTPALVGLLPDRPVQPGDRWQAAAGSVQELTDMEKIDSGALECRFEEITSLSGRRHARVAIAGSLRGVNEDGPTRQDIAGHFFFDLDSQHLSYLTFKGTHFLLDAQGKDAGKIEGQFVLTRQAHVQAPEISAEAIRGIVVEPNSQNTELLYDNADLGVRFFYPRRWRLGGVQGRQITVDETSGSGGMLITLESLARVPAAAQFQAKVRNFFLKQQGKVLRIDPPRVLASGVEYFSMDLDLAGQRRDDGLLPDPPTPGRHRAGGPPDRRRGELACAKWTASPAPWR